MGPVQTCPEKMVFVPKGPVEIQTNPEGETETRQAPSVCLDETEASVETARDVFYPLAVQKWRAEGIYQTDIDWDCVNRLGNKFVNQISQRGNDASQMKRSAQVRFSIEAVQCVRLNSVPAPQRNDFFSSASSAEAPAIVSLDNARAVCKAEGKRLPTELEWLRGVSFVTPPKIKPDFYQAKIIGAAYDHLGPVTEQPTNAIGLRGMETNAPEWTDGYLTVGEGVVLTRSPYGAFLAFGIYGGIRPDATPPALQEAYDPLRVYYAKGNQNWNAGIRCATEPK